jgi:YesN/AraC family two-component response regulator
MKKSLDPEVFKKLVAKGLNCKQIAKKMGYNETYFGLAMKNVLGMYPSVYIARFKNGKT